MSNGGRQKKIKVQDDEKLFCHLCMIEFSTAGSLRNHRSESHDGPCERISPLKCECCDNAVQSRKALKEHVLKCPKIGELKFPRWCSWCKKSTEMTEEEKEKNDLRDVAALADHSYRCGSWPVVVASQEDDWRSFEMELVENTKHAASAELVKRMFVPTVMKLASGERLFGFVLVARAHLLGEEGKVALVSPMKYQLEKTLEDKDLTLALKPF
ncbi:hypothetical protein BGZ81_004722, partial [Podila clonocystis]